MIKELFILLAVLGFSLYLYGVVKVKDVDVNSCRMTYMFGKPQYYRLKTEQSKHPDYGLYYYYEGQPLQPRTMSFSGAPVLFVPGNGGSHKQVRSLASVALQKGSNSRDWRHLDYFTIDYNEQLSALHGGYLRNQQLFLIHCIEVILSLYKSSKQIILIGHSVGGKIAQSALTHNISLAGVINTIIFIATPLDRPVVNFDNAMSEFYEKINKFLLVYRGIDVGGSNDLIQSRRKIEADAKNVNEILLVSIGGGNRDLMVTDSLTVSRYSDVHALTTSVPRVWLSCDHLAVVWCLQLVLVINRFLFSILSNDSSFIANKTIRIKKARTLFGYHNEEDIRDAVVDPNTNSGIWREYARNVFTKLYEVQRESTLLEMIPIKDSTIYIEIFNMNYRGWIYGCTIANPTINKCLNGVDLTNFSIHLPPDNQDRYYIVIPPLTFKKISENWTHIVVRIPPYKQVTLHVHVFDLNESNELILEVVWLSFFPSFFGRQKTLNTLKDKSYYRLQFPDLDDPIHALEIMIEAEPSCMKPYYITARTSVPWAPGFEQYHHKKQNFLSFLFSVPIQKPHDITIINSAVVELFVDPKCSYTVSYKISIGGTLARTVKLYSQYIPAHVAFYLLLGFKHQIDASSSNFENSLNILPFLSAFMQPIKLVALTGTGFVFHKIASFFPIFLTSDHSTNSILVIAIIHSTSLIITLVITGTVWLGLLLAYGVIRLLSACFKLLGLSIHLRNILSYFFPFSIIVLLVSIAYYATGEFTLIFASIVYFLKIAKSIASNRRSPNVKPKLSTDQMHIHMNISLLVILVFVIILNLPAAIAFIQYWRFHSRSSIPDHTLIPSIIILVCLTLIWQFQGRSVWGKKIVGALFYACTIVSIVYCQESIYRLTYLIAFVFVIVLIQQLFSGNKIKLLFLRKVTRN